MSRRPFTEEQAKRVFVDQVHALAEHARLHGPAPDSADRMQAIIVEQRALIQRLRTEERTEREAPRPPPSV